MEIIMSTKNEKRNATERLALTALLTALVAVLSYLGSFIQIGSIAAINLALVPVVIGAAIMGPAAGAWLGAVSGIGVLLSPPTGTFFAISVIGTVVTVMVKGILSGLAAGLVYKLLEKLNRFVGVLGAAIICPVVNTGIFLVGCVLFFKDAIATWASGDGMALIPYMFLGLAGLNFVFELVTNIILSNAIYSILTIFDKRKK